MFCKQCGAEIDDKAVICVHCGTQVMPMNNQVAKAEDKPSTLLKIVCFFIPLVGLILFILMNKDQPLCSKAYGKWALIGFIVGIVLGIIAIVGAIVTMNTYGGGFSYFLDNFDNAIDYGGFYY